MGILPSLYSQDKDLLAEKADIELELSKIKSRALGNVQFIGELFKRQILTEGIMHECIVKLLRAADQESLEALCKLLRTVGKDLDHEKAQVSSMTRHENIVIIPTPDAWTILLACISMTNFI